MSSKLGLAGAYNRRRTLSPLQHQNLQFQDDSSQKYSNTKLLHENKILKEKNTKMREDLEDARSAIKQITSESSHEKVDERRINLIKFQVVQLERQISVMNEALGTRSEAIYEIENTMAWLADKLRSYVASEIKGPTVSISRSDLTSMIEKLESSRIKLFKSVEKCNKEEIGKDILILNPFLCKNKAQEKKLSLIDISLRRKDLLNLQHVSQLESKLCNVYKALIAVYEQIQSRLSGNVMNSEISVEEKRLMDKLLSSSVIVRDASDDLLSLSLLYPSAPWSGLLKPLSKEVPIERVIAALPPLPVNKKEEVVDVISKSIAVCNHRQHLMQKEKLVLKEELDFHRSVYDLQAKYIKDLFDALRGGYSEFKESSESVICEPLQDILAAYKKLRNSSSDTALRDFLLIVKRNEAQLTSIIDMFEKNKDSEFVGEEFDAYTSDLMANLERIKHSCQVQRNESIRENRNIREDQKQRDRELQILLKDLETKYNKQWPPFTQATELRANSRESLLISGMESERSTPDIIVRNQSDRYSHDTKTDVGIEENPTILRSYLDEKSNWVSVLDNTSPDIQSATDGQSLQAKDSTLPCSTESKSSKKWVPNKEWVSEFTSPRYLGGSDSEKDESNTQSQNKTSSRNNSQSRQRRRNNLLYVPNLQVAQKSLKLKGK